MDELETDPASGGRLVDVTSFLLVQRPWLSARSIANILSAIRTHISVTYGYVLTRSPLLSKFLQRYASYPHERRYRQPVSKELITAIASDNSIDFAVRTAVIVAFNGLLRVSEYTASSASSFDPVFSLLRRHARVLLPASATPGAAPCPAVAIRIARSKSDRTNTGQDVFFETASNPSICAASWLRAYLSATAASPAHGVDAPLFIKSNGRFVTAADISAALKLHAGACGLDVQRISSHSLRIGGIYYLFSMGVPEIVVSARARWAPSSCQAMSLLYARMCNKRLKLVAEALASTDGDPVILRASS
jgi:hypothetical protein